MFEISKDVAWSSSQTFFQVGMPRDTCQCNTQDFGEEILLISVWNTEMGVVVKKKRPTSSKQKFSGLITVDGWLAVGVKTQLRFRIPFFVQDAMKSSQNQTKVLPRSISLFLLIVDTINAGNFPAWHSNHCACLASSRPWPSVARAMPVFTRIMKIEKLLLYAICIAMKYVD